MSTCSVSAEAPPVLSASCSLGCLASTSSKRVASGGGTRFVSRVTYGGKVVTHMWLHNASTPAVCGYICGSICGYVCVAVAHLECGRLDRRDWLAHHRQRQRELDSRAAGLAARLGVGGDDGGLEGRRAAEVVTHVWWLHVWWLDTP